jgi:hypothetical protein
MEDVMTQIVETRPLPETFPPGRPQDRQDHPARAPSRQEADPAEEVPFFTALPQMPWPRIFPGL